MFSSSSCDYSGSLVIPERLYSYNYVRYSPAYIHNCHTIANTCLCLATYRDNIQFPNQPHKPKHLGKLDNCVYYQEMVDFQQSTAPREGFPQCWSNYLAQLMRIMLCYCMTSYMWHSKGHTNKIESNKKNLQMCPEIRLPGQLLIFNPWHSEEICTLS